MQLCHVVSLTRTHNHEQFLRIRPAFHELRHLHHAALVPLADMMARGSSFRHGDLRNEALKLTNTFVDSLSVNSHTAAYRLIDISAAALI